MVYFMMLPPCQKIITIEDPIEYHMDGVMQTQIDTDKGYTFAEALRSLLRQNPNVIMVGEIRDKETASVAIESSMTGHLVFSTIHANSAAGAIPRFIGLGIDEEIEMLPEIQKIIQTQSVTNYDIEQAAVAQGTVLMLQDGILKALKGETTIEEVFRVAK